MELPSIKTAMFLGFMSMAPWLLLGTPQSTTDNLAAKKQALEAQIAYRCAQPNVIEVTVRTGLGMKVHNCNKRNSS